VVHETCNARCAYYGPDGFPQEEGR
jgi:hypothetical protein